MRSVSSSLREKAYAEPSERVVTVPAHIGGNQQLTITGMPTALRRRAISALRRTWSSGLPPKPRKAGFSVSGCL